MLGTVLRHAGHARSSRRSGAGEAAVTSGDLEAGRQALHVPLPRPGQGLVEVVDVEHQLALGRAEHAEIGQVGVAAALHVMPESRRGGQVRGHDQRRAPVEGERRDQHPSVADGHQLGTRDGRLLLEQRHRVGPVRRRLPLAVGRAGAAYRAALPRVTLLGPAGSVGLPHRTSQVVPPSALAPVHLDHLPAPLPVGLLDSDRGDPRDPGCGRRRPPIGTGVSDPGGRPDADRQFVRDPNPTRATAWLKANLSVIPAT